MIPTAPHADALMVPVRYKVGETQRERIASVNRIAYPLLGVDNGKGEDAWIRPPRNNETMMFITKDGNDQLYFPFNHPLRGQPRYQWIEDPTGIRRGYLTAEARKDRENQHVG